MDREVRKFKHDIMINMIGAEYVTDSGGKYSYRVVVKKKLDNIESLDKVRDLKLQ